MLIKDLIKQLEKLPAEATIGIVNVYDRTIESSVSITNDRKETVFTMTGESATIGEIEKARRSNEGHICDYYII